MKERPILFNGPMVRALLDGSKTQTRRVVKGAEQWPANTVRATLPGLRGTVMAVDSNRWTYGPEIKCPYGQPGDRLWVRETWQGPLLDDVDDYREDPDKFKNPQFCEYAADGGSAPEFMNMDDELVCRWKPSIHMPRWASRITLEIISVRVERLQDITAADCKAEGIKSQGSDRIGRSWLNYSSSHHGGSWYPEGGDQAPKLSYHSLWESVNGADSWNANPWVWVVEFKRIES